MIDRKCMICGTPIRECMGFVLARDILNKNKQIREICANCSFKINPDIIKDRSAHIPLYNIA